MDDSESDCFTNDMSCSEYDFLNEDEDLSDEGDEWDQEGGAYEEELTDLDTDDDSEDMPMSEHDRDYKLDSRTSSKHSLRTCVQHEMKTNQSYRENFLEVKGAGLVASKREHESNSYESNTFSQGVDGKADLELIAEVERRRLRDFGSHPSHLDLSNQEDAKSSHDHAISTHVNKRKIQGEKDKSSKDKVKVSSCSSVPTAKDGATANVVKTHGEASDMSEGLVSVATPRGDEQPSPALTPSLFPGCLPPTIHFPMPYENCE